MRFPKSTKTAGAAALALTLSISPVASLLPGFTSSAFAVQSIKEPSIASWDLELQHAPFTKNGVLLVPVKELTEYMDLRIIQSTNKKFIYISSPNQSVRITPGQSRAINAKGTILALETAPTVRHGVTYVPASLLAKGFGIHLKSKGKSIVSIQGSAREHVSAAAGNMLIWLNRETLQLSMGEIGKLPEAAGKITLENVDWVNFKARKVNALSYVVEINNWHGEPHIHETYVRALLHKGKIVKQGATHFTNFPGINTKLNINGYKGNVVVMDGSTLQLVHPTGKVVKTYDLAAITGVEDDFVVEAIENDFLLVRPYKAATLFIVHPVLKKAVLIYPDLLDEETQKMIREYPPNEAGFVGDGLAYTGYTNQELTFTFNYPLLNTKNKRFSYKPPF
ncbi:copper amine oxidase N-terminal domain-containing protein [Paenibacillus dakarensis]|uniref:copper amine oxidase N-terminal domain-containing protein n=1 Tax=Paenibacillus dakarensis TaxID=1527293 RepID=UPI0006D589A8|nr:copper amine oxidase N-terminal domain-containing protein [Paenibacillus dakarensis]